MLTELKQLAIVTKQGEADEQFEAAKNYARSIGINNNKTQAFGLFLKAALQGHVEAAHHIGLCYNNGDGIEVNAEKAFEWFLKAAEQGFAESQNCVGVCYLKGIGTAENIPTALQWFIKAADAGILLSHYNKGLCYINDQNYQLAFESFQLVANQGYPDAQDMLAECYYNGYGTPQDTQQAFQLWSHAAIWSNHKESQYKLAEFCYSQNGLLYNPQQAFNLWLQSAIQGFKPSQYKVAECYNKGIGTTLNENQANFWTTKYYS
ncbi:MAG: hypothetical protein BEN18_02040 [Epulopiscium sp. Nuni2H_MBin001]|nr:MAG: hypothetical protein BEN18_02040 [Epulopiscium sp. Nuni2H_MBin001]